MLQRIVMPRALEEKLERRYANYIEKQGFGGRAAVRALEGLMGSARRRFERGLRRMAKSDFEPVSIIANSLTNWQRNQWARAGYPKADVQRFIVLQRPA